MCALRPDNSLRIILCESLGEFKFKSGSLHSSKPYTNNNCNIDLLFMIKKTEYQQQSSCQNLPFYGGMIVVGFYLF